MFCVYWDSCPPGAVFLVDTADRYCVLTFITPSIPSKWNESGFRPPLCTYRLKWARRTSWGWWDDWDDTVLQTQDSKFEPWRSEVEHATSRSRRLPTILTFTRGWGRNIFCFFETAETGNRALAWKAAVLTTTLGPPPRSPRTITHNPRPTSPSTHNPFTHNTLHPQQHIFYPIRW